MLVNWRVLNALFVSTMVDCLTKLYLKTYERKKIKTASALESTNTVINSC